MDTKTTANTSRSAQAKQAWISASARYAAADKRVMALNGIEHSDIEMNKAVYIWGDALRSLLQTRAPDAAALREKLALLLSYDEEDGPILVPNAERAAVLEDFDRIAGTAPQPVNSGPAVSRLQALALQAHHTQAATLSALYDADTAPEAATALAQVTMRLIGEIAEVAEAIEAAESVEKAPTMLAGSKH